MAERPRRSPLTTVVLVGLAAFGAIVLVQWVLSAVLGFVKFVLLAAIVLAVAALVLSSKRD